MHTKKRFSWIMRTVLFCALSLFVFGSYCKYDAPQYANMQIPTVMILPDGFDQMIRILVARGSTVSITGGGYVNVIDPNTGAFVSALSPQITASPTDDGMIINDAQFVGRQVLLRSGSGKFTVGKTVYQGDMFMINDGSTMEVVNHLNLEEYLKGVLPSEIFPSWPPDALRTQAVAARTYAVYEAIFHDGCDYYVTNTVASQVYKGASARTKATDIAVEATRGQILMYKKTVFPAYFHSTCGGHTTDVSRLWNAQFHPALAGVSCPFCRESKHYAWTTSITLVELTERLKKKKYITGDVTGFDIAEDDGWGRVTKVRVVTTDNVHEFKAYEVRVQALVDILKSTFFTVELRGDTLVFNGRGWGHGVGLCQWGMRRMALDGANYQAILSYYYPGAHLGILPQTDSVGRE